VINPELAAGSSPLEEITSVLFPSSDFFSPSFYSDILIFKLLDC